MRRGQTEGSSAYMFAGYACAVASSSLYDVDILIGSPPQTSGGSVAFGVEGCRGHVEREARLLWAVSYIEHFWKEFF